MELLAGFLNCRRHCYILRLFLHEFKPHSAPPTGTHTVGGAECGLKLP